MPPLTRRQPCFELDFSDHLMGLPPEGHLDLSDCFPTAEAALAAAAKVFKPGELPPARRLPYECVSAVCARCGTHDPVHFRDLNDAWSFAAVAGWQITDVATCPTCVIPAPGMWFHHDRITGSDKSLLNYPEWCVITHVSYPAGDVHGAGEGVVYYRVGHAGGPLHSIPFAQLRSIVLGWTVAPMSRQTDDDTMPVEIRFRPDTSGATRPVLYADLTADRIDHLNDCRSRALWVGVIARLALDRAPSPFTIPAADIASVMVTPWPQPREHTQ